MKDLFKEKKRKAIAYTLKRVRDTFQDAMQELRAEIVQQVKDQNDIPKVRAEFNNFAKVIAEAIKQFEIHKNDNFKVNAAKKEAIPELLSLAIETFNKGHEAEAKELFAFAAFNSNDLLMENLPNSPTVRNRCPACASDLPSISNFCPICGIKLENYFTMSPSPLMPAPVEEPQIIMQPQQVPNQQMQVQPQPMQIQPVPMQQNVQPVVHPQQPAMPLNSKTPILMMAELIKKLAKANKYSEINKLLASIK
jgi:hypothetical protein